MGGESRRGRELHAEGSILKLSGREDQGHIRTKAKENHPCAERRGKIGSG